MKLEFWPVLVIQVYALTKKHSLMNQAAVCGKYIITFFTLLIVSYNLSYIYSIVMEYVDNGDLFQKITKH